MEGGIPMTKLLELAQHDIQSNINRLDGRLSDEHKDHLRDHLGDLYRRAYGVVDAITCVFDSMSKGRDSLMINTLERRYTDNARHIDTLEVKNLSKLQEPWIKIHVTRSNADNKVELIQFWDGSSCTVKMAISPNEKDDLFTLLDQAQHRIAEEIVNANPTFLDARPFINLLALIDRKITACEQATEVLISESSQLVNKQMECYDKYLLRSPERCDDPNPNKEG
jgi:hypothetical protein